MYFFSLHSIINLNAFSLSLCSRKIHLCHGSEGLSNILSLFVSMVMGGSVFLTYTQIHRFLVITDLFSSFSY